MQQTQRFDILCQHIIEKFILNGDIIMDCFSFKFVKQLSFAYWTVLPIILLLVIVPNSVILINLKGDWRGHHYYNCSLCVKVSVGATIIRGTSEYPTRSRRRRTTSHFYIVVNRNIGTDISISKACVLRWEWIFMKICL